MPGPVPGIHVFVAFKSWMAGTSPAMTGLVFGAQRRSRRMSDSTTRAMVLERAREPLVARALARAEPGPNQLSLRVLACGVCRTDLHVFDGELEHAKLPLVLGHEIVARVEAVGPDVQGFKLGDRVG